jgi:hypothetical protein
MTDKTTEPRTPVRSDDSGLGLAMFVTFTAACLIVTGAVAMLSLIDASWVLGFAFGVDLLMTAAVALAVFSALSSGAFGIAGGADRADVRADNLERQPRTRIEPRRVHPTAA